MKGYLRIEMLRTLRDTLYIFQAVVVPVGFYLLFSGLFGSAPHAPGTLSGNIEIMVANAIFAGIWVCLGRASPLTGRAVGCATCNSCLSHRGRR